jgi:hypothetical protein
MTKGIEASSRVLLRGPGDWDKWIGIVRKFAKNQNIWKYIDPDTTTKPILDVPTQPSVGQVRDDATEIKDLEGEDLSKFQLLENRYNYQIRTYREELKALAEIQEYIVETVDKYYDLIAKEDSVAEELKILKNRVKPTDWAREDEVKTRYYETLRAAKRTKVEEWISKWQVVLTEATNLGLPETTGLRPTKDFLRAASTIDPVITRIWIAEMEKKAILEPNKEWQETFPDGIRISEIFERQFRTSAISQPKGAFATFQGEEEPSEQPNGQPTEQPKEQRKEQTRGKPHCICGERHYFSECYYLIEEIRPTGWNPDSDIQQRVEQKLQNPKIKAKVERASSRRKQKTEGQAKQDSIKGSAFAGVKMQEQPSSPQHRASFATTDVYPLRDSVIMDSGSDFHICNNSSRFLEDTYEPCEEPEEAFSGESHLQILGYGDTLVRVGNNENFLLKRVAYIPGFHTNVASLDIFLQKGYNWNPSTGAVFTVKNGETIFHTHRRYRQPVIEFNEVQVEQPDTTAAFALSRQPRPKASADAMLWHLRMGHLGANALEQLAEQTTGCKIKGPLKVECQDCAVSKATRIISRRSAQTAAPRPFWRVHLDIFDLHISYNGKSCALLIRDEFTSMIYIYVLQDHTTASVFGSVKVFAALIERQYDLTICRIHRDNDRALQTEYDRWVKKEGIIDESTAPRTPAQNGRAERSGGVIGTQARTMLIGANLPEELWPETWNAAVYLHNRSPQQAKEWRTPSLQLHEWLQKNGRDSSYIQAQPDTTYLKAYGCQAYPLTKEAQKGTQKKDLKTQPHAEVGYLVGYDSTNIFRIWIPERQEVRRVRDVTFNETRFYDPKNHLRQHQAIEPPRLQLPKHVDSESDGEEAIWQHRHQRQDEEDSESEIGSTIEVDMGNRHNDDVEPQSHDSEEEQAPYPTPEPSVRGTQPPKEPPEGQKPPESQSSDRPALRRSARKRQPTEKGKEFFRSSFFAGTSQKMHRRTLPDEPRNYHEVIGHPFEQQFREAMRTEWNQVKARGTVQPIPRDQVSGQILPLTWVLKYKFDKHGYLLKFKARICVRGDLQLLGDKDTYAATLAGRSFRVLMAITAKFDLDTRQLDAVNAFTNSILDEDVYVHFPGGFHRRGWVLKLLRALYGLRRSPLLWQKDLTQAFEQLDLKQCPEEPCLFTNDWLTVFFFVDDIVLLHRPRYKENADEFVTKIRARFDMKDLGELKWFLGIRILRDRAAHKLWLCQDAYIEKMVHQYGIQKNDRFKGSLFPTNELQLRDDQAPEDLVNRYQQKIGSNTYVAVITRPDIAKPVAKLAEFMLNPSDKHHQLVDRIMEYLWATRYLAIQFNGNASSVSISHSSLNPELRIASDAAFADNLQTRKSSQGHIIMLFGGAVSWKAGKQDTVTTSSTEAELLAFTHTAKEAIAMKRLFEQIKLKLDHPLVIECDNQQTIRLIKPDQPRIKTQLKHVDIHNCWARQAYQQGHFQVAYTPTAEMIADGLTKPLPGKKFQRFIEQLALVDICSILEEQDKLEELQSE